MPINKMSLNLGSAPKIKVIQQFLAQYFNLVTVVIVILFFLAAWLYLLEPKRQKIVKEQESYLVQKTGEKEDLTLAMGRIEKYKSDFRKIDESDKEKIKKILLSDSEGKLEKESLFVLFESLIKNQGLILKSISISQEKGAKDKAGAAGVSDLPAGVNAVTVDLEISGANYNSAKSLLDRMEKSLLLMDVVNLNFSPDQGSAALKVVMYYLK